ncbi:MAG: hypothetical protein M1836_006335 [Candelina mexicana]|nr:MAG: hypothetical protein M1836_006335 [Candelina mexicana]
MSPPSHAHTRNKRTSEPPTTPTPLPPHAFAPSYLPSLLSTLPQDKHHLLTHLNSSYFSHPTSRAPTLLQLKQHAQALCNLFRFLDPTTTTTTPNNNNNSTTFDFLQNLEEIYTNPDSTHNLPLPSVRNTLATTLSATGASILTSGCPLQLELSSLSPDGPTHNPSLTAYASHANSLLEVLDENLSAEGGLLSLLPSLGTSERKAAEETILGQWLVYTSNLVRRVGELEKEIINARDVLSGEALVPKSTTSSTFSSNSNLHTATTLPLLTTQDRYILTGLSRELHSTLSAHLTASEHTMAHQGSRAAYEGVGYTDDALRPLAYIDVPSRLFRVAGSEAIFIIPGHGVSEAGRVTREIEGRPVVQSVVRPAWRGRRSVREKRRVEEVVAGLRRELEGLKGELGEREEEVRGLRGEVAVAEGRLGDLVGRERAVGEKALEVQRREERVWRWEERVRKEGESDLGGGVAREKGII